MTRWHYALVFTVLAQIMAAEPIAPRFREVAKDRGLTFRVANHASEDKHLPETMTGGVAVFDADGDGWMDVFFANGAPIPDLRKDGPNDWNRLFRNVEGKRFEDATERSGLSGEGFAMGAAAADYDNDGDVDLFVPGVRINQLFRNRGDGVFDEVAEEVGLRSGGWAAAAAWLDFDNDGLLDLYVVNYLDWSPAFDTYCGDADAKVRSYCHPRLFEGLPDQLFQNMGGGKFRDVSQHAGIHVPGKGMSAVVGDYDLDGLPDLFITNDKHPSFLLHNTGKSFENAGLLAGAALPDSGVPVSAMGADFRDYDRDGWPDIVYTALRGERFLLFRNSGQGSFLDVTTRSGLGAASRQMSGWGVAFADFDNDGSVDLFSANSHVNDTVAHFEPTEYKQHNSLFIQTVTGAFGDASEEAGLTAAPTRAHRGSAVFDYNRDGRLDIVVSSLDGPVELWENQGPTGNWLRVVPRGKASNRDGLQVRVRANGMQNTMKSSVGYSSSSLTPIHFGLGSAARVAELEIIWPSGARQLLRDVEANQTVTVVEHPD